MMTQIESENLFRGVNNEERKERKFERNKGMIVTNEGGNMKEKD